MSINQETINNWLKYEENSFQNSLQFNSIGDLARNQDEIVNNPYLFNTEVKPSLPITNQASSGRCWLFASCNLVRIEAHKHWKETYNLEVNDLELSQNYLFFWDKIERYHRNLRYYLDMISTENVNKERYLYYIYDDPISDGGQWDMAKEIIKKYGVVPKSVYPDSKHSKGSREMNKILKEKLKEDMLKLSRTSKEELENTISLMMSKVYKLLVGFLGKPPTNFTWTFSSKGKVLTWKDMTPLSFLEKTGFKSDDWVSVINDPRKQNEYNKFYQVKYLGNTQDQHVGWINLEMTRFKDLVTKSIKDNTPVWFGCDVCNNWDRKSGIHSLDILKLKECADIEFNQTKEERLNSYTSLPNHAMVIVGYHKTKDDTNVQRWKIENSWGSSSGHKGFLLMTDTWFSEYVFQVLIQKKYLSQDELKLLDTEPSIIEPWDPLGTLA